MSAFEESVGVQAKNGQGIFCSDSPNEDLEIQLALHYLENDHTNLHALGVLFF